MKNSCFLISVSTNLFKKNDVSEVKCKFSFTFTRSFFILFWLAETDPFALKFRMKLNWETERYKWTLNERWAQGDRKEKWESRTFQGLYMNVQFFNVPSLLLWHIAVYMYNQYTIGVH